MNQQLAAQNAAIAFTLVGNEGAVPFFSFNTSEATSNQVQLSIT